MAESTPEPVRIPLVSVVTPCFNGEEHVGRLIQSVLDQTYPNIEFILVNDGSTDGTDSVVESFRARLDEELTRFVYVQQKNQGLGGAINSGLAHVTGEYLAWPDADDYLEPESVELRACVLTESNEYAVVTSDAYLRPENDKESVLGVISERYKHTRDPHQFEYLLRAESIFTPGCHMVRMQAFDATHETRSIYPARRGQNWQILLPIYYEYKRFFLDVPLYNYVVHHQSMSRGDDTVERKMHRIDEHRDIRLKTLEIMEIPESERVKWIAEVEKIHSEASAEIHLDHGSREVAKKFYLKRLGLGSMSFRDRLRFNVKMLLARFRLKR